LKNLSAEAGGGRRAEIVQWFSAPRFWLTGDEASLFQTIRLQRSVLKKMNKVCENKQKIEGGEEMFKNNSKEYLISYVLNKNLSFDKCPI